MPGAMLVRHDASSITQVRHRLAADLLVQGLPKAVVYDAALLVSELVGNAVRYGRPLGNGDLQVRWENGAEDVRIEVSDGGGPSPVRRRSICPDATRGRGLAIVATLADDWGVQRDDSGTMVWAHVCRGAPAPAALSG